MIECSPFEAEVMGSISGRVIPKILKRDFLLPGIERIEKGNMAGLSTADVKLWLGK